MTEKPEKLPIFQILGIRVHSLKLQKAVSLVENWVKTNKQYQIVTPNPEQVVLAQKNKRFRQVLNQADLAIPDGIGLIWANKILSSVRMGSKQKEESKGQTQDLIKLRRLSGVDLMIALCQLAAKKGWRVFLLGGGPGMAAQAIDSINITRTKLKIASFEGAKNINQETKKEKEKARKLINKFKPDLLFVAYGAPYQELWIAENLPYLKTKVAMGVGGTFDYLAGKVARAPKIVRQTGFEWLYRLIQQPWRWKRQLRLIEFCWLVLKEIRR